MLKQLIRPKSEINTSIDKIFNIFAPFKIKCCE